MAFLDFFLLDIPGNNSYISILEYGMNRKILNSWDVNLATSQIKHTSIYPELQL